MVVSPNIEIGTGVSPQNRPEAGIRHVQRAPCGSRTHSRSDPARKQVVKASYPSAVGQGEAAATSLAGCCLCPDLDSFNILDLFLNHNKQNKRASFHVLCLTGAFWTCSDMNLSSICHSHGLWFLSALSVKYF